MAPIKDGIYQLRLVPAGSDAPSPLAATGDGIGQPVRAMPSIPPLFAKQNWLVRRVHDNSYTIEWTVRMGPPVYFSIEGSVRPDVPVRLFPTRQEWVITEGKGENIFRVSPATQMIGVDWALEKADDEELQLRPFPIGVSTPQWLFVQVEED